MSWIVKFEKEVESCDDCLMIGGESPVCTCDGKMGKIIDGKWHDPSDIRPCPLIKKEE